MFYYKERKKQSNIVILLNFQTLWRFKQLPIRNNDL